MIDTMQRLEAGMLSVTLEPDGGLRQIKWGRHEILMRLYAAVRDRDWGTVPAVLSDVSIEAGEDEFAVTFRCTHHQGDIHFYWDGAITGRSDGTLSYSLSGVSGSEFLSNRIGFCVLHSMDCAGHRCVVTHSDGSETKSSFPQTISPHQPFFNMASISHEVSEPLWASVSFSGEVFEMEDQRNWTDASFKTYCTPLSRPYPVQVLTGTRIRQSVSISVNDVSAEIHPSSETAAVITINHKETCPFPAIGLELSPSLETPNSFQFGKLKELGLFHLRVDLDLSNPTYPILLERAAALARDLELTLEAALFLSLDFERELADLAKRLDSSLSVIATWLAFPKDGTITGTEYFAGVRSHLGPLTPLARFGGGTDHNFSELNRGRGLLAPMDIVSYSINPQVHAFDDLSLFETLAAQKTTAQMAGSFRPGAAVAVSPVTLKPRRQADVRQKQQIAAAWTLGCIKSLTEGGVRSMTFFETFGPCGVMSEDAVFPLYDVLKSVLEFGAESVLGVQSSDHMRSLGLCLRNGNRLRLIVANTSAESQFVKFVMDPSLSFPASGNLDELLLEPYAIATIDGIQRK